MAALPYIQLYVADYLADTMHLQADEHGAYLLLIFNYWQTGKPIPKSRLQAITRVSSERWPAVMEALAEFFEDDGDNWIHLRIEADLSAINTRPRGRALPGNESLSGYRGYVYFVGSDDSKRVKIGYSKNPWARLTELRRDYDGELRVLATIKTVGKSERSVHETLSDFHEENEWFTKSILIDRLISRISAKEVVSVADLEATVAELRSATTTTTNTDTDTDTDKREGKPSLKRARKTPLDFSAWQSKPSDQVLADWMAMRKANRAPVSQTVIDQFGIQINLAAADSRTADECLSMCVVKAWRGFKYQWLKNEEAGNAGNQRPAGQSRSDRNDQALREYFAHVDAEENSGHDLDGAIQPEAGDGVGGQFGAHAVRA